MHDHPGAGADGVKITMSKNNLPTKAGIYFARRYKSDDWWNYLVGVSGEVPFMRIEWSISLAEWKSLKLEVHQVGDWGPEVVRPDIPMDLVEPKP